MVVVVVVKAGAKSVIECSGHPPNTGLTAEEIVRPSPAFVVQLFSIRPGKRTQVPWLPSPCLFSRGIELLFCVCPLP